MYIDETWCENQAGGIHFKVNDGTRYFANLGDVPIFN
jgi:hypothetical protein